MLETTAQTINILGRFCGKRDVEELTAKQLMRDYGIIQADVMVLFGGSILCGGDILAQAIRQKIAKKYVIVGGEGHTTEIFRKRMQEEFPEVETAGLSEAQIFANYIRQRYGLKADYLECTSTNCGSNITCLLKLLEEKMVPFQSMILLHDATMQRRIEAVLKKYVRKPVQIINYAAYKAKTVVRDGSLAYAQEIPGMWDMNQYIRLLLGEIARLTDDENGYGPKGKNYLVHVDIPPEVQKAFLELRAVYPGLVRKAEPQYAKGRI